MLVTGRPESGIADILLSHDFAKGVVCLEVMHGNYGRLLSVGMEGLACFSMTVTRSKLPYESEYPSFFCVGKVPEYNLGYPLTLYGEWKEEGTGRWKFDVSDFEEDIKSGRMLQDFLVSECMGVGEKTAGKFAELGEELWEMAYDRNGAEILRKRTGAAEAACRTALSVLRKKEEKYRAYQYLCVYGITDLKIDKLMGEYGTGTLDAVRDDPYRVLHSMNIPFRIADEIGFCEGMTHYHRKRIIGLIGYSISRLTGNGSTWVDIHKLYDEIEMASMNSVYHEKIPRGLISVVLKDIRWLYIDRDAGHIYLKEIWRSEWAIANGISRLKKSSIPLGFDEGMIAGVEEELGITYAGRQREAFAILKSTGVKVLTGGPGTGKTTLVEGLVRIYKRMCPGNRIALCAPTGMASEHMAEAAGMPASTIHRLLNYRPFSGGDSSYKSAENPIKADFIIVDETSMADTKLMGMLFDAVPPGALLLLCGDVNQLDSVGCGAVLHDIISSGAVDVYGLDALFRQEKDSHIASNSARINRKDINLAVGDDFEIYRFRDKEDFYRIFRKELEKYMDDPFSARTSGSLGAFGSLQILSTTKKGDFGTRSLNAFVQDRIEYGEGRTVCRNGYVFHRGDKIMTVANNYKAGYYNGDIGQITEISDLGNVTVQIGKKNIRMQNAWLEDMMPAYAVTIHKSQGSEFPYVIIILPKQPTLLLDRSIIYTAVTRAKKKAVILSQENALEYGIGQDKRQDRNTGLLEKIRKNKQPPEVC